MDSQIQWPSMIPNRGTATMAYILLKPWLVHSLQFYYRHTKSSAQQIHSNLSFCSTNKIDYRLNKIKLSARHSFVKRKIDLLQMWIRCAAVRASIHFSAASMRIAMKWKLVCQVYEKKNESKPNRVLEFHSMTEQSLNVRQSTCHVRFLFVSHRFMRFSVQSIKRAIVISIQNSQYLGCPLQLACQMEFGIRNAFMRGKCEVCFFPRFHLNSFERFSCKTHR